MQYITGIHALNLPCSLNTSGDWHTSAIQWEHPHTRASEDSVFGDFGIERDRHIPEHEGTYAVADHLRALLDLLEEGNLSTAQGARDDFICNSSYHLIFFEKAYLLKGKSGWEAVDRFMHKEFGKEWRIWKTGVRGTEQ